MTQLKFLPTLVLSALAFTACKKEDYPLTSIIHPQAHEVIQKGKVNKISLILTNANVVDGRYLEKDELVSHTIVQGIQRDLSDKDVADITSSFTGVSSVHEAIIEDLKKGKFYSKSGVQEIEPYIARKQRVELSYNFKPNCYASLKESFKSLHRDFPENVSTFRTRMAEKKPLGRFDTSCLNGAEGDLVVLADVNLIAFTSGEGKFDSTQKSNPILDVYKNHYSFLESPFGYLGTKYVVISKDSGDIYFADITATGGQRLRTPMDVPEHFNALVQKAFGLSKFSKLYL